MDQLVIIIVIAVIGLIKWLMEKSAEQRSKRATSERLDRVERNAPPTIAPRPVAFPLPDPDAAARRLREALGLPEEHELPPPVPHPRHEPRPAPVFRVEEIEEIQILPEVERHVRHVVEAPPLPPLKPLRKSAAAVEAAPPARGGLEELLRSREGLRKAILAQEILGTPKGLVF